MSVISVFFSEWKNNHFIIEVLTLCFFFILTQSEWITVTIKGKVSKSYEALLKNSADNNNNKNDRNNKNIKQTKKNKKKKWP